MFYYCKVSIIFYTLSRDSCLWILNITLYYFIMLYTPGILCSFELNRFNSSKRLMWSLVILLQVQRTWLAVIQKWSQLSFVFVLSRRAHWTHIHTHTHIHTTRITQECIHQKGCFWQPALLHQLLGSLFEEKVNAASEELCLENIWSVLAVLFFF